MTDRLFRIARTVAALAAVVLVAGSIPALATGAGGRVLENRALQIPTPPLEVVALPEFKIGYVEVDGDEYYNPSIFWYYNPPAPLGRPYAGAVLGIQDSW